MICPERPYPIRGGGALRTASLIEYLRRDHDVELIVFYDGDAAEPSTPGNTLTLSLPHHSRSAWARVRRNAGRLARGVVPLIDRFSGFHRQMEEWMADRRYDVAVLEHLWLAPYADLLRTRATRLILNLHNVESALMGQLAPPFVYAARNAEARWLPVFDRVLVASPEDQGRINVRSIVYPNAVPDRPMPPRSEGLSAALSVAMSANFEYAPNRQGREWFEKRVWPALSREFQGLEWRLIGKGARVVEDAVAELAGSQVAVVPIFAGSGTRLKILEAWSAGTPVVSTTLGAEGLGGVDGQHFLLADTPATFRLRVAQLLSEPALRENLRRSARKLLEMSFTWSRAWERLDRQGGLY